MLRHPLPVIRIAQDIRFPEGRGGVGRQGPDARDDEDNQGDSDDPQRVGRGGMQGVEESAGGVGVGDSSAHRVIVEIAQVRVHPRTQRQEGVGEPGGGGEQGEDSDDGRGRGEPEPAGHGGDDEGLSRDDRQGDGGVIKNGEDFVHHGARGDEPVVGGVLGEVGQRGGEVAHGGERDGGGDAGDERCAEPEGDGGEVDTLADVSSAGHGSDDTLGG